jgi:rfaE bifunctional protein kinase chain/domain
MWGNLKRSRLEDLLAACSSVKIGVVGDFALDGYWYADMSQSELSREAPLFNHPVVRETYSAGGAANVAANLASLGVRETRAYTVFGRDWRGDLLSQVLNDLGVRLDAIETQPGWSTPFFGKVILMGFGNQQEDARVDFINTDPLTEETISSFLDKIESSLTELDGLIVADYLENGVLGARVTESLNRMAEEHRDVIFAVDSRNRIDQFRSMVIKPNEVEVARAFFPEHDPHSIELDELAQMGLDIQSRSGRPVYITLGEAGSLVCCPPDSVRIEAIPVPPPLDTVGAGDTFVAALTTGLASGASPVEAGCLATLATAVNIRKLGMTGTASQAEILETYDQFVGEK